MYSRNDVESKEELDNLLEESSMPLQTLLERYKAPGKPDDESKLTDAVAANSLVLYLYKLQVHATDWRKRDSSPFCRLEESVCLFVCSGPVILRHAWVSFLLVVEQKFGYWIKWWWSRWIWTRYSIVYKFVLTILLYIGLHKLVRQYTSGVCTSWLYCGCPKFSVITHTL